MDVPSQTVRSQTVQSQTEIQQRSFQLGLFMSRATWSFLDQAFVSFGTFVVSVILARQLSTSEYGIFALLLAINFTVQLFSYWLVSYPLTLRLANARGDKGLALIASSILAVATLCVPFAGLVGSALWYYDRVGLILPGTLWLASFQIQQALRRALLADLRHRGAVVGDAVSSFGQVMILGLIVLTVGLSISNALYGIAFAFMLGAITQVRQLRLHRTLSGFYAPHRWLIDNASLGGRSLAANAISTVRVYALFWLLAALSGPTIVGSMQAAINMFMPLNLVLFSLINLIPQVTARAFDNGDRRDAWRMARPYVLIALPPTIMYVVFALCFRETLLLAFYGSGSPYLQLGHLFPSLALSYAAMIPLELMLSYFLGVRNTRLVLKINLLGAATIAISVLPMFANFGLLEGACVALALGDVVRVCAALLSLQQIISAGRSAPMPSHETGYRDHSVYRNPACVESIKSGEPTMPTHESPRNCKRLKILVSAFACEPGRGSEPGNGWGAVEYLSRRHDVTAIVSPMCRAGIEKHLQSCPLPSVRWKFVDLPDWIIGRKYLKKDPAYIYCYLWQLWALRAARELNQQFQFDVAHHITLGCYWRPSFLALLKVPYVWGPVGGAQSVPRAYRSTLPTRDRLFSLAKISAERAAITFDPFVKMTARRANIAITNTSKGAQRMRQLGARRIHELPQLSLPASEIEHFGKMPVRRVASPFRLISMGRLVGWKGIHIALQAFANFHSRYADSEYCHIGDGPMQQELTRMARTFGVEDCFTIVTGASRQEAFEYLARSDVLLFPCLHDEPGWVALEGMAAGRPVLFVHGRPGVPGSDQAGFTPRLDRPENSIADLSQAMLILAQDPALRFAMGEAGRRLVRDHYAMENLFGAIENLLCEVAEQRKTECPTEPAISATGSPFAIRSGS